MAGEGMKAARKERGLAREEPARVLFFSLRLDKYTP